MDNFFLTATLAAAIQPCRVRPFEGREHPSLLGLPSKRARPEPPAARPPESRRLAYYAGAGRGRQEPRRGAPANPWIVLIRLTQDRRLMGRPLWAAAHTRLGPRLGPSAPNPLLIMGFGTDGPKKRVGRGVQPRSAKPRACLKRTFLTTACFERLAGVIVTVFRLCSVAGRAAGVRARRSR